MRPSSSRKANGYSSGLSRYGDGHGLPHHDDQRPGRGGLGRRRDRSRGLHARPADFDAAAAGGRLQAEGHSLPKGATATDLVLTVTQMLRARRAWSESLSSSTAPGVRALGLADRATIANMAPEYGATIGFFPVDDGDARLSANVEPPARADRAGGGVRQGAGPVPAPPTSPDPVYTRHAGAGLSAK